jgi:hypothetical protein
VGGKKYGILKSRRTSRRAKKAKQDFAGYGLVAFCVIYKQIEIH